MIFPVKHKYFISVMNGSVTFLLLSETQISFHCNPRSGCSNTSTVCLTCSAVQTQSISLVSVTLILYPGSRPVTSCPGTETPYYEGTGSRRGADCCSAPGAAGVSAKKTHVNILCCRRTQHITRDLESELWLLNILDIRSNAE